MCFDERRPGTLETFAGQFLRCVHLLFVASGVSRIILFPCTLYASAGGSWGEVEPTHVGCYGIRGAAS
jgi:hypothetical protein